MKSVAAFFYGLFMDADLLRGKGLRVQDSRMARLDDCRLRIGTRATLVPARGASVYGMLIQLPPEDLQKLYADPGVSAYIPQSVEVVLNDGVRVAASCYVLPSCVQDFLANPSYAQKLHALAAKLGLPAEYLAVIERAGVNA